MNKLRVIVHVDFAFGWCYREARVVKLRRYLHALPCPHLLLYVHIYLWSKLLVTEEFDRKCTWPWVGAHNSERYRAYRHIRHSSSIFFPFSIESSTIDFANRTHNNIVTPFRPLLRLPLGFYPSETTENHKLFVAERTGEVWCRHADTQTRIQYGVNISRKIRRYV